MEVFRKRGSVSWTDENGVYYRVSEAEYDAMMAGNRVTVVTDPEEVVPAVEEPVVPEEPIAQGSISKLFS